jgi:leucyl aminopeptidase (aminopeptidase T)
MKEVIMYRSATTLIDILAGVAEGEKVLILTDFLTEDISKILASVTYSLGAEPITMSMPPRKGHGDALPAAVAAAMKEVDVVIAPTTYNIAHTKARHEAQAAGARILILPESHENILLSKGLRADFIALRPQVEWVADILTNGKQVRITTSQGTDLRLSVQGREGRALTGFANTKDISAAHCIESSIAPVEGSVEGVLVVDGSIPGIGLIDTPVIVKFKEGKAVSITGGKEAERFRKVLEERNDEEGNIYFAGEFGIGMNPECELENSMLSDEGVFGTIHVALGTNAYIGGVIKAKGHYDMVVKDAEVEIDGKVILRNNELYL